MIWKDFSKAFKDGEHAFLGASTHSWYNYDDEKLIKVFLNKLAASKGSALHALACSMIKMRIRLPDNGQTLSMYVNDCIDNRMRPEQKLWYSKYSYGTADSIQFDGKTLKIFDLKTGVTKVSFLQLKIYAALFFLSYPEIKPKDIEIQLRIYQSNGVMEDYPELDEIIPIMDKIKKFSIILEEMETEYDK
jgi:hypothetical protein